MDRTPKTFKEFDAIHTQPNWHGEVALLQSGRIRVLWGVLEVFGEARLVQLKINRCHGAEIGYVVMTLPLESVATRKHGVVVLRWRKERGVSVATIESCRGCINMR